MPVTALSGLQAVANGSFKLRQTAGHHSFIIRFALYSKPSFIHKRPATDKQALEKALRFMYSYIELKVNMLLLLCWRTQNAL